MPYRNQEARELCAFCRTLTDVRCPRCGNYVCDAHGPAAGDERCRRCEHEYSILVSERRRQLARKQPDPWAAPLGLVFMSLPVLLISELGAARWLLFVGALVFAALWAVVSGTQRLAWGYEREHLETQLRRRFLAERSDDDVPRV